MGWKRLSDFVGSLEESGELLRIPDPVDVELEAGCFADRMVKRGGPAIKFEQPRLPDGSISPFPLLMNLYGTRDRTNRALGVTEPKEVGEKMTALMKPDVGAIMRAPWKGIGLALDGMSMAPRRTSRGACQQVVMEDPDVTVLPIPKTWPEDGGRFMTLPLVVTADPTTGEHNMGMYRSQVFGPTEVGLHWQAHKHGADHADAATGRMPVAICLGGPPELTFSAIAPLPDNLSEYEFAGLLSGRRLPIVKCKTNDLWVPADCDIVIEGYTVPGETRMEGPFGDHFGYYSLAEPYPVMHVTRISHRRDAMVPMTIVGTPPMEDGYLGEAIGDAFLPVLRFQHRDVAAPWDNIHDKLIIDATTTPKGDPHSDLPDQQGCPESLAVSASAVSGVIQARMLRPSMLVVTTDIEGGPKPESSMERISEDGAARQREVIREICDSIWSLEAAKNLRWLFITDDDAYLASEDWRRRMLWQLFCRFDVGRDLHFDETGGRVAWDATAPIPSNKGPLPVRRWPGMTLHDPEVAERVDAWLAEGGY